MATLSKLYVSMGFKDDGYSAGIDKSKKQASGLGSFLSGAISTAGGFLLAEMIARVTSSVAGMVTAGMDFGREMANVNSIAQLSDGALTQLGDAVINIAKDPRISQGPAELAAGLYNIYSSGFQGAEGLNVLQQAAMAATAGVTDSETAARVGAAALNAYGLSGDQAGRIFDVLFQTVNDGVISFDELANNMGNTLPIASSLGVQIEELGAAYALMTLKGVGASAAETQISALMRSALAPTASLTTAVQAYGYESAEALVRTEGLAGLLKVLGEASGGSQSELLKLLGTQEAMNAATILGANGVDDYTTELGKMQDASKDGGATQKALEKQMKSAAYQIGQVKKQAEIFGVTLFRMLEPTIASASRAVATFIGVLTTLATYFLFVVRDGDYLNDFLMDLPAPLRGITAAIGEVVAGTVAFVSGMMAAFRSGKRISEIVTTLPDPLQGLARGFLLVADAAGDLVARFRTDGLTGLLSELPSALGQIWDGLTSIGAEVLTIAIDTAVSIAGWLWDNRGDIWGGIKDAVGWTVSTFSDAVSVAIDGAISLAGDLADAAGNLWGWLKNKLTGGAAGSSATGADTAIGSQSIPIGTVLLDGLLDLGAYLAGVAADFGAWLWPHLKSGWNNALVVGTVALNGALVLADGFLDLPWGDYADTVLTSAQAAFAQVPWGSIWDSITSFATGLWEKFQNFDYNNAGFIVGQGLRSAIEAIGPTLVTLAGDLLTFFWDGLQANWQTILKWFALWPILIPAAIVGAAVVLVPKAWEFIKGFLEGLGLNWDTQVVPWFTALPGRALDAIGDLTTTAYQKGVDILQGFWDGLVAQWINIGAWFAGRDDSAKEYIGDLSTTLYSKGTALIEGLWDGAGESWDSFTGWLEGRGAAIASFVGDLSEVLWAAGRDAIQGLINGAQSKIPGLQSMVDTAIAIFRQIPLLGNSPWPMMIEAGQDAMDGLAIGAESRMRRLDATVGRAIGAFAQPVAAGAFSASAGALGAGGGGGAVYVTIQPGAIVVNEAEHGERTADVVFGKFAREAGLTWG